MAQLKEQLADLGHEMLLDLEEEFGVALRLRYTDGAGVLRPLPTKEDLEGLLRQAQELRVSAGPAPPAPGRAAYPKAFVG